MQINCTKGFDLDQSRSFGSVIIIQNRSTGMVRVIVLTRKHRPPKHRANQTDEQQ